ncbi:phosphotransferase [Arcanobacterium hippocoleae]
MESFRTLLPHVTQFDFAENVASIIPWGDGHINKTYKVITDSQPYLLQRMNETVFSDIPRLMENIQLVTEFLAQRNQETLEIVPTIDGKLYYTSETGGKYRLYKFITETISYSMVTDPEIVRSAGAAFGQFQKIWQSLTPQSSPRQFRIFIILRVVLKIYSSRFSKIRPAE